MQEYVRDNHHPNSHFLNNVLNVYLNLAAEHVSLQSGQRSNQVSG